MLVTRSRNAGDSEPEHREHFAINADRVAPEGEVGRGMTRISDELGATVVGIGKVWQMLQDGAKQRHVKVSEFKRNTFYVAVVDLRRTARQREHFFDGMKRGYWYCHHAFDTRLPDKSRRPT